MRSEGPVTAGDLICPPEVEIVNPELLLLTADSPDVDLDLELTVNRGRGYSPAEERGKLPLGEIPVDAIYSPVRKVNYTVTRARIGQQTNYDRLTLEIWTDGTMTPEAALRESAKLLVRHLTLIAGADVTPAEQAAAETRSGVPSRIYDVPIEDLELTVRAYNCLKRAGITKVGEVLERLEKGEEEILAIRNFGRKSLNELVEKLEQGYLSAIAYQPSTDLAEFEDGGEAEEEVLRGVFSMRHRVAGYKLGRNTSQRSSLRRNLITELFRYDRIQTTEAKAKSMRGEAEHLITVAKRGLADGGNPVHARRLAARVITDPEVTKRLFDEVAPRFTERPGGYMRRAQARAPPWATAPRW